MIWHIGLVPEVSPYSVREFLKLYKRSGLSGWGVSTPADRSRMNRLFYPWYEWYDIEFSEELYLIYVHTAILYGFITPRLSENLPEQHIDPLLLPFIKGVPDLTGLPFQITPNGYRLLKADVVAGQQECFLRSLLAYRIPSPIEKGYKCTPFSPLKYVIDLLFEVSAQGAEKTLSFEEYALYVQTSSPDDGVHQVAANIIDFRQRRKASKGNIREFDRASYKQVVLKDSASLTPEQIKTKAQTLDDYADLSLRYLKATGLFKSKGRGIVLAPIKEEQTQLIHETNYNLLADADYLLNLWNGAKLPTDDLPAEEKVVRDLMNKVQAMGGTITLLRPNDDISQKRHSLEQQLSRLEEEVYAYNQADQLDEIAGWLEALAKNGSITTATGERITVPKGEAPAYFEWATWRAFLAINSLNNKPWEARRFQIDQDFLPVGTAPGNGPDMIFEFDDCIIVVEVTLTTSSRQEAAEGEPVRRHVARYAEEQINNGKKVYGLFLAVTIDSNTANTFRIGEWYLKDDSKLFLQIVPMRLDDFHKLFVSGKNRLSEMAGILKVVIEQCRTQAKEEAPAWKRVISEVVQNNLNG